MDDLDFFLDLFLDALKARLPEAMRAANVTLRPSAARAAKTGPGRTLNMRFTPVLRVNGKFQPSPYGQRFLNRSVVRVTDNPTPDQLSFAVKHALKGQGVLYDLAHTMLHSVDRANGEIKRWCELVDEIAEAIALEIPMHRQPAVDFDFEVDVDAA